MYPARFLHAFPPRCVLLRSIVVLCGIITALRATAAPPAGQDEAVSNVRLHSVMSALALYRTLHPDKPAPSLTQLYEAGFVPGLDTFQAGNAAVSLTSSADIEKLGDFTLESADAKDPAKVILKERFGFHGGKALALSGDGKMEKIAAPPPPEGRVREPLVIPQSRAAPAAKPSQSRSFWTSALLWYSLLIHHIVFAICVFSLARRSAVPRPWLALIPIAALVPFCQAAGKSPRLAWWFLFPAVNIGLFFYLWLHWAKKNGRTPWLAAGATVPFCCLAAQPWLAFNLPALRRPRPAVPKAPVPPLPLAELPAHPAAPPPSPVAMEHPAASAITETPPPEAAAPASRLRMKQKGPGPAAVVEPSSSGNTAAPSRLRSTMGKPRPKPRGDTDIP